MLSFNFNIEHFKTNRGKPAILCEGFRLRKDRDSKAAYLWRCRTDLEDIMILGGRFDQDHVEEDRTIERQALRQTCKQKAGTEPCERTNKQITRSVNRGNSASTL